MECDYPSAKRARFCSSSDMEPQSCHLAAAVTAMDYGAVAKEVAMQDASQPDAGRQSDHCRRKNSMPIMERFFLGLLTERDLYERGIRLTQEQLSFHRKIRQGYY